MQTETPKSIQQQIAHTPTPWTVDSNEGWVITADYDGEAVAEVSLRNPDAEEMSGEDSANARLISAAPDLLEALKTAKRMLRQAGVTCTPRVNEEIDAALAKAEGKQ